MKRRPFHGPPTAARVLGMLHGEPAPVPAAIDARPEAGDIGYRRTVARSIAAALQKEIVDPYAREHGMPSPLVRIDIAEEDSDP